MQVDAGIKAHRPLVSRGCLAPWGPGLVPGPHRVLLAGGDRDACGGLGDRELAGVQQLHVLLLPGGLGAGVVRRRCERPSVWGLHEDRAALSGWTRDARHGRLAHFLEVVTDEQPE